MLDTIQAPTTLPQNVIATMRTVGFTVIAAADLNVLMGFGGNGLDLNDLKIEGE